MTSMIAEETAPSPAQAAGGQPQPNQKATRAPHRADVAPKKLKSAKKATSAKKAPKSALKATPKLPAARPGKGAKEKGIREGSKTKKVLDLLKRQGGITLKELMKATGWQPHSVRGFISGTLGRKMGLTVVSAKGEDKERTYSIKA